ncbi:hypothetical protein GCM10007304_17820 [Rhodococcoides trifolii]|uniref:Portal protein n=1 Tax=Rhodococcoides trifolii TaxID=908250 RepID=A0A917CZV8_9NOCA|nr:hypothetical protein [Rhodococcus trifolii]GGG04126.1 hypothetical protein GCM10007304_17820 [Rhodococcus trifolii]
MTTPARRRGRRPESTAAQEAEALTPSRSTVANTRIRNVPGAIIGHYNLPNSTDDTEALTAAAQVVHGPNVAQTSKAQWKKMPWQQESWELRKEIGEFRFAGDRVARGVSRVVFFGAKVENPMNAPTPVEDGPALDLAQGMFGSRARTQQVTKRAAQHLSFAGESLFVISEDEHGNHTLEPRSTNEVTGSGTNWKLNDGIENRNLRDDELVVRCWIPDPEYSALPDCPARAVLSNARTLRELSKHTSAQVESRLAGAGMLLVPQEIEALAGQGASGFDDEDDIDPFVRDLMVSMVTPVKDRDSASALVPFVAKLPAELIDKIKHITFTTPLDPQAKDLRSEEIRRIALGMDAPPEVLLGMGSGGANHWSAWQISEDEVTLSISPVAATICHALTVGWYQPALEQLGVPDWDKYQIWFDTSPLALRPDRSKDAQSLFDKDELSAEALLRESGFDDDDVPDDTERTRRLMIRLLDANPNFAYALLPAIVPNIDRSVIDALTGVTAAPANNPGDENPTPSRGAGTADRTDTAIPDPPDSTITPDDGATP